MRDFDTICAIATPIGEGGIAIIRVSGENALEIVSKVFRAKSGTDIKNMKSYTMKYGHIYDGDDLIDEVSNFHFFIHIHRIFRHNTIIC